ncbi:MAG: HD domain-containing phosphohydrolase [Deltaproteobacteria bacterium]
MTKQINIFIVEDDEAHAELILRSFDSHWGDFAATVKGSLSSARAYLAENMPDLVLCDWLLPDGKGIELIPPPDHEQRLYPIVLMTSHGNEELAVEAMKAGALDYIVKSPEAFSHMPDFIIRALREWEHIVAREQAEMSLKKVLLQTVESLAMMVEKRDPYTSGHQKKVSELAYNIGREMKLSEDTLQGIYIAGILHDIGKISVPAEYLSKPGKLDPIEFTIIKTHPGVAYDMLKAIDFPYPIATIVLQHHEKCDGSGYPHGLKGADLLLEARIITVADVVDAISSHRPYRPSLGIGAALEEISTHAGTLYDKDVVAACLAFFAARA